MSLGEVQQRWLCGCCCGGGGGGGCVLWTMEASEQAPLYCLWDWCGCGISLKQAWFRKTNPSQGQDCPVSVTKENISALHFHPGICTRMIQGIRMESPAYVSHCHYDIFQIEDNVIKRGLTLVSFHWRTRNFMNDNAESQIRYSRVTSW